MKLWLLERLDADLGDDAPKHYEECYGFVVRAKDEESARAMVQGGDELARCPNFWRDARFSSCVELHAHGEPGVIMTDFLNS